jgi:hypothetical protein
VDFVHVPEFFDRHCCDLYSTARESECGINPLHQPKARGAWAADQPHHGGPGIPGNSRSLLRNYHQKDQLLGNRLSPADTRIQSFLDSYLKNICPEGAARLPVDSFGLDSRELDGDTPNVQVVQETSPSVQAVVEMAAQRVEFRNDAGPASWPW